MLMILQDSRCKGVDRNLHAADAFDWKSTGMGNLQLDIWHNHRDSIGGNQDNNDSPFSLLKRIFKPIDRAANSFLQEWLGVLMCRLICVAEGFCGSPILQMWLPKWRSSIRVTHK
jgi:hypothetical protein